MNSADITVQWDLPKRFADLGVVPVLLFDADGAVVASGVSGAALQVPVGSYYFGVKLPDGTTVIGGEKATIADGIGTLPTLVDELGRRVDLDHFRSDAKAAESTPLAPEADTADPAGLAYHLRGDLFRAIGQDPTIIQPMSPAMPQQLSGGRYELARVSADDQVLLVRGADSCRMIVLPFDQPTEDKPDPIENIVLEFDPQAVRVRFLSSVSTVTNALAQYVEHGLLNDSTSVSAGLLQQASTDSPVTGSLLGLLLSAYVLLRQNALDQLEDALRQTEHAASILPDYWAIAAELYARQGRHDAAIDALSKCVDQRCPWFRSGLGYILQRLDFYLEAEKSGPFTLEGTLNQRFTAHVRTLRIMAARLDPRELMTTFFLEQVDFDQMRFSDAGIEIIEVIKTGLDSLESEEAEEWMTIAEGVLE